MATIIDVDGMIEQVEIPEDDNLSLKFMQDIVGGYIEVIPFNRGFIVVDEEGLLKNLPLNSPVSTLLGRPIVGKVIYCEEGEMR